jgi:hypothetical protein
MTLISKTKHQEKIHLQFFDFCEMKNSECETARINNKLNHSSKQLPEHLFSTFPRFYQAKSSNFKGEKHSKHF